MDRSVMRARFFATQVQVRNFKDFLWGKKKRRRRRRRRKVKAIVIDIARTCRAKSISIWIMTERVSVLTRFAFLFISLTAGISAVFSEPFHFAAKACLFS